MDNGCNCGFDPRTDAAFVTAHPELRRAANFSSGKYVTDARAKGLRGDGLMLDPVVKAKILFDFVSQQAAWRDIYASLKAVAAAARARRSRGLRQRPHR